MLLLDGVPSSPKVPIVLNTPPSGESVGVPPMKLTLPLTLNVSTVPGVSEMPTCTGESAGAVSGGVASGAQHADPLGMPARYGFALPGTVTPTVAPRAGDTATHTSAIAPRSIGRAHISAPLGSMGWLPSRLRSDTARDSSHKSSYLDDRPRSRRSPSGKSLRQQTVNSGRPGTSGGDSQAER